MKRLLYAALILLAGLGTASSQQVEKASPQVQTAKVDVPGELQAIQAQKLRLLERDTSLTAKEQEVQKLAVDLERQMKALDEATKKLQEAEAQRKKEADERTDKLLKVYKALKPDQAANLMNQLRPEMTIDMLNRLDKKTVVRLIPFLNQPRVLQWTVENFGAVKTEAAQPPMLSKNEANEPQSEGKTEVDAGEAMN